MIQGMGLNSTATNFFGASTIRDIGAVKSKGLNFREAEIFNRIREDVASALDIPVELGGERQSGRGGQSIAFITGNSEFSQNERFVLPLSVLKEMAADEASYNLWMSRIQRMIRPESELEESLSNISNVTDENETEHTNQQVRLQMMAMINPFWLENREQGQFAQPMHGNTISHMLIPTNENIFHKLSS